MFFFRKKTDRPQRRVRCLAVTDFKHFCSRNKSSSLNILFRQQETAVYPVSFIDEQSSKPGVCKTHEQYIASVSKARIIASSNVIIANKRIIYDLLKGGRFRITDPGLILRKCHHAEMRAPRRLGMLYFAAYYDFGTSFDKAVSLFGNYSWNFYHFIYEIAQKFYLIDAARIPEDIPLLVDAVVKKVPQLNEIFDLLKGNRKAYFLEELESCRVETLYYPSFVHQIPPNFWDMNKIADEDCYFDGNGLRYLRSRFLDYAKGVESPLSTQTANKIFISRKVTQNRSYNEDELIKIACQYGYTVVYPEQYSIREQFALFSQVDSIIAASGAALSNIVCCKPGCKILVLTSSHWNLTVFSNIAGHLNLDMEYLCGKTDNPNNVQSGFVIDAGIFRKVLNM